MSSVGVGLGIGAGVGISSVALAPFNAANTFMGSAFFGYGMILGERYMYQADWPKIQARLENGEKIENIIQEYTGTFTAVVMKEAKIIFDTVTTEFIEIMQKAIADTIPQPVTQPTTGPGIGDPRRTSPGQEPVTPVTPTTKQPTPKPVTKLKIGNLNPSELTELKIQTNKAQDNINAKLQQIAINNHNIVLWKNVKNPTAQQGINIKRTEKETVKLKQQINTLQNIIDNNMIIINSY